ncbi:MAG TPA: DUF4136 domain-containing protein [Candidatus Aquilonibacter sp.]|nr:DUF4136 domain-containing protein [Candidatus Aquilonibacter sp.]
MKNVMQYFHSAAASGLIAVLVFTQTAIAQQPSQQTAQASQQATQQATQAAQQAMQDNQQAAQQAAAAAAQSSSSLPVGLGGINHPSAPQVPGGPLPAAIASAHTVLLTNVGVSARLGLDSNELYNDIHQRMQQWGYYQLVSTPQQADLIFQLDEIDPRNGTNVTPGTDVYNRTPSFRIVILDAKTGIALWTVTSPIYITGKKTYAHWMDVSEENLMTRLKALAQQPVSPAEQATLTEYPPNHRGLLLGLVIAIPVVAGVGGYLAYRHSIADQKANQDAFCTANNIPLSMCAGG